MLTNKIKELQAKGYLVVIEPNRIRPTILKITLSKDKKSYAIGCNTEGYSDKAGRDAFIDDTLARLETIFEEQND